MRDCAMALRWPEARSMLQGAKEIVGRRWQRRSPSTLRNAALAAVVVFLLLLGVAVAAVLRSGYLYHVREAETRAAQLTQLLEEHTLRNMQAVDLVLQVIADSSPSDLDRHDARFQDWMRRRLQQIPHVRALFVIDADGFPTQDTNDPGTPPVNVADRGYFIFHKDNPDAGLHVSPPLLSRRVDSWFVPVSRRLNNRDGSFAGVVVASVDPSFYEVLYADLPLDRSDAIALWHADGILISRTPEDLGMVGEKVRGTRVFSEYLPKATSGVFIAQRVFDPGERIVVGYRELPGMPLVVTAALSLTPATTRFWTVVYAVAVGFALLCVLGVTTTLLIFRRIREREEALQRSAVLQKFEALGRMTGGIAHDFNNLLGVINGATRLWSKHANDPEKARGYATAAQEAVQRGTKLTSQLLQFAKGQELEIKAADANALLTNLQPMLRHAAGPGIRVNFHLASELPPCLLDRTQFDSAILNLVVNAHDAMPEGGEVSISTAHWTQPKTTARALKPGSYVVVRVKDTGKGIPPEIASRVFEPYFTTKGDQGTGLGLAQVYGFMHRIGGDARIVGETGAGTTVELYFPGIEDQPSPSRAASRELRRSEAEPAS